MNVRFKDLLIYFLAHLGSPHIMTITKIQKQPPEVLTVKKGVLKNFAIFIRKHLNWSLFLIFERDSNTGACLRNLRNFEKHLF